MTDDQDIAALRAQYGDEIVIHKSSFGWLVFGAPEQDAYEDFLDEVTRDKSKKAAAMRSLCLRSVKQPSRQELIDIFKKRAGLPAIIAGKLTALAQDEAEALAKKD